MTAVTAARRKEESTTQDQPALDIPALAADHHAPRSARAATFLKWSRRVTVVGWLSIIGMIIWGIQSGVLTHIDRLREFVAGFGPLAPFVYTLMGASEAVFPVVPGSVTLIGAPVLFGPIVGFLTAYAATCLGSSAVFALSRHVGQDLLYTRFRPATVKRYLGWLQHRHFTRYFALAIALPVAPDDLICYLAGLSNMRWRTFLTVILLLKPWALMIYIFGVLKILSLWFPWLTS